MSFRANAAVTGCATGVCLGGLLGAWVAVRASLGQPAQLGEGFGLELALGFLGAVLGRRLDARRRNREMQEREASDS